MPNIIRCTCGLVVRVAEDVSAARRLCPGCGQPLAASGLPAANAGAALSTADSAPVQRASAETVPLKPYYALEEPPTIGYRVVELKDHAEGSSLDRTADKTPYPVPRERDHSRWSDIDRGNLDVRAILAKAKHELRNERRRRPRPWPLEKNGGQCLFYPFRVWWRIVHLALVWTITMSVLANIQLAVEGSEAWFPNLPLFYLVPLFLVGVTWNFLRQVLRLAVMGNRERVPVCGYCDPAAIAHSALLAGGAFLAGPVVFLAGALWFWVHAGTLEWLDHLLLWQLWLCAGVSWVYLLLAVDARGRLLDAQAAAVVTLVRRQGWPALVFPLLGGASLTVFVYLSVRTWILSFDEGFQAFLVQFILWCAGLFLWTFLLRWYGITRYWRRQARPSGGFNGSGP